MGRKHKHSKDKLYKTVSELDSHHTVKNRELDLSNLHRRLKFDTCCLSLNTIRGKPVGLVDDSNFCYVFDSELILKFFKKHLINPVTGKDVSRNDLISLNFHKNLDGQYHCPITLKPLNQFSKIVANKKTGHVYSNDAYQQFNVKTNHFKDLLTDEPFIRSDIVIIQDPSKVDEKWNVKEFHHVKFGLKYPIGDSDHDNETDDDEASNGPRSKTMTASDIMKSTLDEYKRHANESDRIHERLFGSKEIERVDKRVPKTAFDKVNSAIESDGLMSKSVTSTIEPVINTQLPALLNNEQILYPRIKKKGYVIISTNLGPINVELLCDRTPRTCHNFLQLARRGYYDDTIFHRLIKNFMIQGGDPTGTGKGGESAWLEPFKDEFHRDLKHDGRGILAMANSGPDTNRSQFYFILKGTWPHLDGKHTVFGKVMGGIDTLDAINELPTDKNDRPKQDVKLLSIKIYHDPFAEVEKLIEEERDQREKKKRKNEDQDDGQPKRYHSGIGGYIDIKCRKQDIGLKGDEDTRKDKHVDNSSKKSSKSKSYGNFSNW